MVLAGKEIYQVQFVLPMVGNLKNLTLAAQILNRLNIKEEDVASESERDIDLSSDEIEFLKSMIMILDENQKLSIQGLSLYTKILNIKE